MASENGIEAEGPQESDNDTENDSQETERCWTVLSELRYKVAYNPTTFSLNWKQRTAGKAVEDALQYIKIYVAGV